MEELLKDLSLSRSTSIEDLYGFELAADEMAVLDAAGSPIRGGSCAQGY